eukprot:jgi/Chrpa1/17443/Chrysochromulina_OHIO_Genome00000846-RA
MEGKFTSVHDALYQKPSTHPLLSTGLNPHIQKFMERKAPKPIAIRTANHVREDVSIVHYPKPELKDTVILKNMNMRMAIKDDKLPVPIEKKKIWGRVKSDITSGHENLYERSYY